MRIMNWDEFLLPYEQAVDELILKFDTIIDQHKAINRHCPIVEVEGRVKSVGSIISKMNKKNVNQDDIEEKIEDIAGIRLICQFVEDIEKAIDIIKNRDDYDMKVIHEKDYITNTKRSGYRSHHLIISYPVFVLGEKKEIKAEIQIRTMSMNFWATIEHSLKYKYDSNIPEHVAERLRASAEAAFLLDQEMSTIREEIMEAEKIAKIVDDTVDELLGNLQKIYTSAKVDEVNDLNREFIEIYQKGNVDELLAFAEQVRIIGDLYKVRFPK